MVSLPKHRLRIVLLSLVALVAACSDDDTPPDNVGPGNNHIALSDVNAITAEDTAVTVTIPVTADNVVRTVLSAQGGPSHGTLEMRGADWTYTPDADFNGSDEIVIQAEDGFGAQYGQASAKLKITITSEADAPRPQDDGDLSTTGAPIAIAQSTLLANDVDPDGDALSFVSAQGASHGTVAVSGSSVVFTPDLDFSGIASFTYTVTDGTLSGTATVRVSASPSPHAKPIANADDITVTSTDGVVTIPVSALLANDRDPEGNPLTITRAGALMVDSLGYGDITVSATQLTFTPANGYYGAGQFTYALSNGYHEVFGTVKVTVQPGPRTGDVSVFSLSDPVFDVAPGGTVVYDIDVDGPISTPVDVTVTDEVPADLTCSWTCSSASRMGACPAASGTGSIRQTVRVYISLKFKLTCTVSASTTAQSFTNAVSITPTSWFTDTKAENNTDSITLDVRR